MPNCGNRSKVKVCWELIGEKQAASVSSDAQHDPASGDLICHHRVAYDFLVSPSFTGNQGGIQEENGRVATI
jgi:hypothetical protein